MTEDINAVEIEIRRRKDEGRSLFNPAKITALKLGTRCPKKHGANMVYRDSVISIHYDTYAPNLSVYYDEELVLNFHLGTITRYIPSADWVHHLLSLARPLIEAEENKKALEQEERERKRLESWGL